MKNKAQETACASGVFCVRVIHSNVEGAKLCVNKQLRSKATNRSPSGAADPSCPKSQRRTHWVGCVNSEELGPYHHHHHHCYKYCPLLPRVCPANPCHQGWGLQSPGWLCGARSSGHWCPLEMGSGPEYWKCSAFGCGDHRSKSTGHPAPRREEESLWCSLGNPQGVRLQSKAWPVCPGAAGNGWGRGDVRAAKGGVEKKVGREWVGCYGGLTGRGLDWL